MSQVLVKAQDGFALIGSARSGATSNCIQLTNSNNSQTGAVWFNKQLQLTASFELTFTINLGSNPAGADGIVLVFQTQGIQVIGGPSGGIGYKNIRPSLGVEFDTNQNLEAGDPPEDHIALVRNGISDHRLNSGFGAPIPILTTQPTAKDGRDHYVKVNWDTKTHTLSVEVDCIPRISQTIDLVDTIFAGITEATWGFTSATGARGNAHMVCITSKESLPDTIKACRSDRISLEAPLSSNGKYQWSPSVDLDNPQSRTPSLSVGNSQLFTVQYFDHCAQPKLDSVFVNAKGVSFTIGNDRQICENDTITLKPILVPANIPVTYRWSTGQTTPQLNPTISGQYSLTVTADGCSVSDSTTITVNPLPKFSLSVDPAYDCPGSQPIELDPQATGVGFSYFWTPDGSTTPTMMADKPGPYTVEVTTDMGCSAIQRFTILDNCPLLQIFVPDAFTPNGDGMNDVFRWQDSGNVEARMNVFDRWGEIVFVSTNSAPYWDGTYQGKLCPPAIYTWSLEYQPRQTTNQQKVIIQGKVVLLK